MVTTPDGPPRHRRWPAVAFALLGAAAAVGGVAAVGRLARDTLGPQDRYRVRFADVDCPSPPGLERTRFLDEVQYLGEVPDALNLLDPAMPERLRAAFAKHKHVARVGQAVATPPKNVRVELEFRD